jgi:metallophosphoesterase (TIGR00282 family)
MKLLFVGDVVGRGGRRVVRENLKAIQQANDIDFTVVNAENAAGGFGVTASIAEDFLRMDVDVLTSGNHVWDQKGVDVLLERQPRLLRPGNYPPGLPGSHIWVGESRAGVPVAVINLQGRVFMPLTDCPFRMIERELERLGGQPRVTLVDFHAEATSEKMAFGWFVDGKVSAVVGTHTHVPTADVRVLPGGTAYVTDVGMTGSYDSVIGMKKEPSLSRFLTGLNARFEPETKDARFSSVVIDIDETSGRARSIRRCDNPAWASQDVI